METERIYNLTEQEYLMDRTGYMQSDNSSSQRSSYDTESENLFYKYSPSKPVMVEEQECLKRPLAVDRGLTVPFKKRKQLNEESYSSWISTNQNLQTSDSNEGINATFNLKFDKENFYSSTPSSNHKAYENDQIEFNLQSSIFVKAEDSAEWSRLKCFDSITLNESNSATFFTGGPIQSSTFFISPHDVKANQYIAVAVGNAFYKNSSYTDTKNTSGIIQLWNLGSLHERKLLDQLPSMELALYHDNGIITEMKWSPADCFDKYPSTNHLPRMGMLAAASSNSCVYVYNVPQPDFMPKLEPTFPIYFTEPDLKLTPLFGEPSNVTMKTTTTCVEWEKSGERIVAGYGNGSVCVWMIKVPGYTSKIGVKRLEQSYIIHPYLFFQAAGTPITSLSFAPFSNNRWLSVLSEDGFVRLYDLLNTSIPFMSVKQGLGSHCIWGESFCGVYSAPVLNSLGRIALSVTDIYAEGLKKPYKEKDKSQSRIIQKIGVFDSSTNLVASGNGSFHAIADMTGAVLVNFLVDQCKPLETSYLSYILFETEIMTLDIVDLEMKTSQSKINISGTILNKGISSLNEAKGPFLTKVKDESLSSSSSSGFCSPKNKKTFVIELAQCFKDDAGSLLQIDPAFSDLSSFKDKNNNGINTILNKSLDFEEETNNKMIKFPEFSGDLMHDLLMLKVSKQSKSSSHILPFNNSNNSACCDSDGAKYVSCGAIVLSSADSDYTGDTIIYPKEDYYCDTSHQNAFSSNESNALSKNLVLNEKRNTLHETIVHKPNVKPSLELEYLTVNRVNFAHLEVNPVNPCSNANLSSNNCSESNPEKYHLNYKNKNLEKINYSGSDLESFIFNNSSPSNNYPLNLKCSDVHREKYPYSKKYQMNIIKNEGLMVGMNSKVNLIPNNDTANLSLNKKCDDPINDVPRPCNLNQPESVIDVYVSKTSKDFIICDRDQKVSFGAYNHSSSVSDYSDDTIIYHDESNNYNDMKYLITKDSGGIAKSLFNTKQENTFQDISLNEMGQELILHESTSKLLKENCNSFTRVKCEKITGKNSQKCNSEYETGSATECFSYSDNNSNFNQKTLSISNFSLLHSEYLYYTSEEKNNLYNGSSLRNKDPRKLSFESLVSSFGVIFKNGLDKYKNPLISQKDGISVDYNPLSVIQTMSWNSNEGCQSWLFVGGNSGIGRLVYVPDYLSNIKNKPKRRKKH